MTATVAELVAFLEAAISEDERVARALYGHQWKAEPDGDGWAIDLDLGQGPDETWGACVTCNDSGGNELDEPTATHIVRHDPARVLAECEAKRKVIGWYTEAAALADVERERGDDGAFLQMLAFEDVLRALAMARKGDPGFRAEWG